MNTDCLSPIFHLDCTKWCTCRFTLLTHVLKKSQSFWSQCAEVETKWATWLYHQFNQSIHVTDGVIVKSLSASLL